MVRGRRAESVSCWSEMPRDDCGPGVTVERIMAGSNNLAGFLWGVADLLRGDFKQSQYGRIILPFTLLRRLECVLAPTRDEVLRVAAEHRSSP